MRMRISVLRTVWALAAALVLSAPAVAGTVVISDGDFQTSDWSLIVSSTGSASQTVARQASGGDPGAYRRMTHTVSPDHSITGYHFYEGATYDPGVSGAITSIDYSEDRIQYDKPFDSAKVGSLFLIEQDGEGIFFASTSLEFGDTTWSTATLTSLASTNFGKVSGAGSLDFTANGGEMTFGYLRSNTNDPNGDPWTTTHGIDDFTVTIHNTAVVPLPAAAWAGLLLLGGLAVARRMRLRARVF